MVAKRSGPGMISPPRAGGAMNFHNQGVARARYQGPGGSGFTVEFLDVKAMRGFAEGIEDGALVIAESSIESVVLTIDTMKQKLRGYLDGVFGKSTVTRNLHRRATNAMVQSATYNDMEGKGQFTGLLYSKLGRGLGPASFIDYLLLHLRGGTIEPQTGNWLRLPVDDESRRLKAQGGFIQTGYYPATGTSVFFRRSKDDPDKLFLFRSSGRGGGLQLLDVLLKNVRIPPILAGLQPLLDESEAIFERNMDQVWARRSAEAGLA